MKQRRNRFVAIVLVLVLTLTQQPWSANADTGLGITHNHNEAGSGWISLTQAKMDSLAESGHIVNGSEKTVYYISNLLESGTTLSVFLEEDIELEYLILWDKRDCTLNLCLNGHVLDAGGGTAFWVGAVDSVLNIVDCGSITHYYADDDEDGCYETCKGETAPAGTENVDFVSITGGAITNSNSEYVVYGRVGEVNFDNIDIVGCAALYYVIETDNSCDVDMNNSRIVGCTAGSALLHASADFGMHNCTIAGNHGKIAITNQGNLLIDNGCIEDNYLGRSVLDNDTGNKLTLSNCTIRKNIIAVEDAFCNYAVSVWNSELILSGVVIITDNIVYNDEYPDGIQSNLCVMDENMCDIPFNASGLTEGTAIGLTLCSVLPAGGSKVVCTGVNNPGVSFSSDLPLYQLQEIDDEIVLKKRFAGQPNEVNGYTCSVIGDDVSVSYQWYQAECEESDFIISGDDIEIEPFGSADDSGIAPAECTETSVGYFLFMAQAGDCIKISNKFEEGSVPENSTLACTNWGKYKSECVPAKINEEAEFFIEEDGTYGIFGCFGDEPSYENLKIKNVHRERVTIGDPLTGQTTNRLTAAEAGSYVCRISFKDSENCTQTVQSKVITIDEPIIPLYTVTFDANGHGTPPEAITNVANAATISEPASPSATDYTFEGWYKEAACTNEWDFNNDKVTGDITLYAKWTENNDPDPYNPPFVIIIPESFMKPEPTIEPEPANPQPTQEATEGYTVPVEAEKESVQVSAQIDDGIASVDEITEDKLEEIIEKKTSEEETGKEEIAESETDAEENSNSVTIDISGTKKNVMGVELTKKSVENLADVTNDEKNGIDSVVIKMKEASVELDAKTLETLRESMAGDTLKLVVDKSEEKSLNESQKNTLADLNANGTFEAYFESNGKKIHDFKGGTARVSVSFTPAKGTAAKNYKVYYLDENGGLQKHATKYENGRLTFITSHFSDFVVIYDNVKEVLLAEAETTKKDYIKLSWNEIDGAVRYIVHGAMCGKTYQKLAETDGNSFTIKKINDEKPVLGKTYKLYVVAYDALGNKLKSKSIHYVVGDASAEYANVKTITALQQTIELTVGEKTTVGAEYTMYDKKKHISKSHGKALRFTSNCPDVVKVSSNGTLTAKSEGTAVIYIQDISGKWCEVEVTVKEK